MRRSSSRGQSTIGYAIVLGIALIGVVTVLALGASAVTDIQDSSGDGAAEQAMTQFDSRTAQVALGDSRDQTVSIGDTGGSYRVDPDAGSVRIVHYNFDGNASDGDDAGPPGDGDFEVGASADGDEDNDREIYESDLGAVYYERGDTTIGYQAGGVWKQTRSGSTMISPPEFHYRGSTLTFPVVRVNQNGGGVQSGAGSLDLQVSQNGESRDIFPTRSDGYPGTTGNNEGFNETGSGNPYGADGFTDDNNGDGGYYENPATNGTVVVYIESEFYRAWAEYFRTRTDGQVSTSDDDDGFATTADDPDGDGPKGTVAVSLESTGFSGPFGMPNSGGSIFLQGIEDHSLTDYGITLYPDDNDEADFSNLQWSLFVQDGGEKFEFNIRHAGQAPDNGAPCDIRNYRATIFYSPPDDNDYHMWTNDTAYQSTCEDWDDDGTQEPKLVLDFVDDDDNDGSVHDAESTDPRLFYESEPNALQRFGTNSRSLMSTVEFDQHAGDIDPDDDLDWEPKTYDDDIADTTTPSNETIDRLTNHYFSVLGPGFELTVDDKNSDTVTEDASKGRIYYPGGSSFITYMHITENDVTVRFD